MKLKALSIWQNFGLATTLLTTVLSTLPKVVLGQPVPISLYFTLGRHYKLTGQIEEVQ